MTDATVEQMLLDSKLVGCMIRGLTSSAISEDGDNFKYINCLDREYSDDPCNITSVEFDISRYGKYTHTLNFDKAISEKEVITKVEEYLSEPLTEEYYSQIVDDLFHGSSYEEIKEDFLCRGHCLTDCKFLESTCVTNGKLEFFIGS